MIARGCGGLSIRFLPSLKGLDRFGRLDPAMNGWAIFGVAAPLASRSGLPMFQPRPLTAFGGAIAGFVSALEGLVEKGHVLFGVRTVAGVQHHSS
jgi:hypothetical protein